MSKASTKKRKKPKKRGSIPDSRRTLFGFVDEAIAQREKETVIEIAAGEKTRGQALELALTAIILADHLIGLFEAENSLPRSIACRPGCDFCCYNQIELTPPEALLLGDYVERNFSDHDRQKLRDKIERSVNIMAGKGKKEIAQIRQELPCPFLEEGQCLVYPVRPLVCRAMHALDARQCEAALKSTDLMAAEHYAHRRVFTMSVVKGLLDGCREIGCESGSLDLAGALKDFFAQPSPIERWLMGEKVFSRLSPLAWRTR